jgi:hypothetical protein
MATPNETNTAERIIGIFSCSGAGMQKMFSSIFYLINLLKSTENPPFFLSGFRCKELIYIDMKMLIC